MFRLRSFTGALCLYAVVTLAAEEPAKRELEPATNALPAFTAISAKGFVHSTERGFKFPDGTVQTTAAGVGGGVPNVNGITGAVTITGTGATVVTTGAGTISVNTRPTYSRTVIVKPTVGNSTASGTILRTALAAITDATSDFRYLLRIEPGTYDLGAEQLVMKNFIDIEGSGRDNTVIIGSRGSTGFQAAAAAVVGAANAELRDLTVKNVASDNLGFAIYVDTKNAFRLTNLSAIAHGGSTAVGIAYQSSAGALDRVSVVASENTGNTAYGVYASGSTLRITNSEIVANGFGASDALQMFTSNVDADSSIFRAEDGTTVNRAVLVGSGTVTLTNCTLDAREGPQRYGVYTNPAADAKAFVHHSRVIAGNAWSTLNQVSLSRGTGSTLEAYTSFIDSASAGSPTCVFTYFTGGPNSVSNVCMGPIP